MIEIPERTERTEAFDRPLFESSSDALASGLQCLAHRNSADETRWYLGRHPTTTATATVLLLLLRMRMRMKMRM